MVESELADFRGVHQRYGLDLEQGDRRVCHDGGGTGSRTVPDIALLAEKMPGPFDPQGFAFPDYLYFSVGYDEYKIALLAFADQTGADRCAYPSADAQYLP